MALATRPKRNSPQHKKRSGQHHRHSKHYLKAYWPYLPMLVIVALGLWVNTLWSTHSVLGASSDFSASSLLTDTNADRAQAADSPLSINSQLAAAAQAKANDMVARNYWAHDTPDGRTPWSFITAAGYQYQSAGENLAFGFDNASDTVIGWMNSPEHRANILDTSYQDVGFGIASSPDFDGRGAGTVIVAEYGQPASNAVHITFSVPQTPLNTSTTNPSTAGTNTTQTANSTELAAQPVSRIQLLTGGQAAWSLGLVSALTGAALAVFVLRHGFRVRRAVNRGEMFIVHHPYVDIAIVLLITIGFILTRTSGLIR